MKKLTITTFVFILTLCCFQTQAQWSTQTSGTTNNLFAVTFLDANTGWAVGASGTILKTTNGGTNWSAQTSGTTNHLYAVVFLDANTGWAVGASGTILKTTNGGTNWSTQTSGTTQLLLGVTFFDVNTGWIVGNGATILKTTDGGANWTAQTSGTTFNLRNVTFLDANTGWIVGTSGVVLKTTNGGTNWNTQTSGTTNHLFGAMFLDANTGWAVGQSGVIIKTTNGGTNWNTQTPGPNHLYAVTFLDANTGWAVGSSGTIIKTTDGGTNWSTEASGTTNQLRGVVFMDANTGWTVGTSGTILKHGTPLPVELTYFKGRVLTEGSLLEWQTASEENNTGFEIERGADGRNWENIDFVEGNGTTLEQQNYTFTDENPLNGVNYYRLKQIDYDGQYEYSEMINIEFLALTNEVLQVFPNPVQDKLNIIHGEGQATIYNLLGQPVQSFSINSETFTVNTNDLAKGQYILQIAQEDGNILTKRFIK